MAANMSTLGPIRAYSCYLRSAQGGFPYSSHGPNYESCGEIFNEFRTQNIYFNRTAQPRTKLYKIWRVVGTSGYTIQSNDKNPGFQDSL